MGRRQNRKRQRREMQRSGDGWGWLQPLPPVVTPESIAFAEPEPEAGRTVVCGGCREFVEDGEFGRGTCLHPASGVMAPWDDTPACDYYAAARRGVRLRGE